NKLLQWRMDNYFTELPEPRRLEVEPRLLQLYWPMAKVAQSTTALAVLEELILEIQSELDEELERSPEDRIATALWELIRQGLAPPISYDLVAQEGFGQVSPIAVGRFVKSIGIKTRKPHRGSREIVSTLQEIGHALTRAGFRAEDTA